jgi:hypothetical protein
VKTIETSVSGARRPVHVAAETAQVGTWPGKGTLIFPAVPAGLNIAVAALPDVAAGLDPLVFPPPQPAVSSRAAQKNAAGLRIISLLNMTPSFPSVPSTFFNISFYRHYTVLKMKFKI